MITDAQGNRIAGDGPTGREIHLIEVIKDGKPAWGLAPVGGAFDKLEVIQVLSQAAMGVATKARLEIAHAEALDKVKNSLEK